MITVHCDLCKESSVQARELHEAKGFQVVRISYQYSNQGKTFNLCDTCSKRIGLPEMQSLTTTDQFEELLREIIQEEIVSERETG